MVLTRNCHQYSGDNMFKWNMLFHNRSVEVAIAAFYRKIAVVTAFRTYQRQNAVTLKPP